MRNLFLKKSISQYLYISAFDLASGKPPLNELVVSKRTRMPAQDWESIRGYLRQEFGVNAEYISHEKAQEECWKFWGRENKRRLSDAEVAEGEWQDKRAGFRARNRRIVEARKKLDRYTCQACGYVKNVNGTYVIDCHHLHPLGMKSDVRITRIEDLLCLCPNCHRISHSSRYPLSIAEIKDVLGDA